MRYKIITAIPKTPIEIFGEGAKNILDFTEIVGENRYVYTSQMLEVAKKGERLLFYPIIADGYDYIDDDNNFYWRKEWLKDIREEVDWEKVPVGTPIIVSNCKEAFDNGKGLKRCFAKYESGIVYAWSGEISNWEYAKLAEDNASESNEN